MASSMGPAKMVTDGLVLHLDAGNTKSYPGSGTVWTDLSQTAITGSLTNGPTFSSTANGAIVFDGTNDNITLSSTLGNGLTRLTLECWVSTTAGSGHMISKGTFSDYQYALRIGTGDLFGGGATGSAIVIAWQSAGSNHNTATTNFSINDSNWHHIVGVIVENTSAKIYLDGVLRETRTNPTGSWDKTGNANVMVGGRADGGANYLSGSISLVKIYNRDLSDNEVFQNYEATRERFNRPTIVTDTDALNFLNAANISSETQQRAVNDLVVDMKNVGLWGKMKAIYPFVGGTAASHKWNLKDPRDVDAAFRLTFSGGWTHSSTGAKGNGTTAYADTFIIPTTHLTQNNTHLSYYSRTADVAQYVELGYYNNGTAIIQMTTRYTGFGGIAGSYSTANQVVASVSSGTYYGINSKTSSTSLKMYRNGVQLGTTNTTSDVQFTNLIGKIYLNARNDNGTTVFYSARECAFATIGDGLTDTDAANLYTIVQKYQTTLGRQV